MGLLKAGTGALGGVLADQWREYFYCDSLDADILAAKGEKRTSSRSSNTKGENNVITNGSVIAVNDGQCMIIVEQGKIVEICAEPGEFVYDSSTEPSIFYGGLSEGIKKSFAEIGKRFTFGGDTGIDQRIYYFNTKEITGNKYGTASPVPFRVIDRNIGLDIDISIRCHGEYSYKITNPILFYTNVCGNIDDTFERANIDSQLKTELMTALQPAFAKISAMGIRYSELPAHTMEIADALNDVLSEKWHDLRGLDVVSFGVSAVNAPEEDEEMIKELQRNAVFRDPSMGAAHMVGAQAQAMQDAAKNQGGMGAMGGFFNMNMAQNTGGANISDLYSMGNSKSSTDGWDCTCGTQGNNGKFCSNCGKQQPDASGWICKCGAENYGNFCSNCGSARAQSFKCKKCGFESESPFKFCCECGTAFED